MKATGDGDGDTSTRHSLMPVGEEASGRVTRSRSRALQSARELRRVFERAVAERHAQGLYL